MRVPMSDWRSRIRQISPEYPSSSGVCHLSLKGRPTAAVMSRGPATGPPAGKSRPRLGLNEATRLRDKGQKAPIKIPRGFRVSGDCVCVCVLMNAAHMNGLARR